MPAPDRTAVGAGSALLRGVSIMAGLLARTLGPGMGPVLSGTGSGPPEVLADSATVARRITRLSNAREHTGAMLVREMAHAVHRRYGDGAATAAVLAQAMIASAHRVVAAGANPVQVRRGIERAVAAADTALAGQAAPVAGPDELARLATSATGDPQLGDVLGEMFDVLGEHADIVVAERPTAGLDREYPDGARWTARPAYRELLPEGTTRLTLPDPLVVAVDQQLTATDVVAAIELGQAARRVVVLVARGVEEPARRLLARHHHAASGAVVTAMVLTAPERRLTAELDDLALLTGGVVRCDQAGTPTRTMDVASCGQARRVVLARHRLEVAGGGGEPAPVASRVAALTALAASGDRGERGDPEWAKLRARAARLAGAVGVLVVGAGSDHERKLTSERVTKAQRVLELAQTEGVVAGGGVGYLQCIPAVHAVRDQCATPDERTGVDVVAGALRAPFRQVVANHATVTPELALHRVGELGDGWGYDVRAGTYARLGRTGVVDSAGVARGALAAAGSLAATVATAGGVVPARRRAADHG